MRQSARSPLAALLTTLGVVTITTLVLASAPIAEAATSAAGPPTVVATTVTAPAVTPAATLAAAPGVCAGQVAPPPAVDASEAVAPGQASPGPLPTPASPVGGSQLGSCGLILPAGAPALPADLGYSSWVIQDADTGQILAAQAPHDRFRPASLLKLLLALVVVRNLDPNQVITGTQDDANQPGTKVGVGPGGQYTVDVLLHGLLMDSGNDIAYALAMAMGGVPVTLAKMDALARSLGCLDTRAATPSGLDGPGMASSAYDLSVIFRAGLNNPLIADVFHTTQIQFPGYGGKPPYPIYNQNTLLTTYPGDLGGKLGYTTDAQHTYANAASRNGHRIALIMMHGTNHLDGMYQNANELMNYGFALLDAHTAPVGQLVAASPAANVAANKAALVTSSALAGHPASGTAQPGLEQPVPAMSTFGNVGGPLTVLAGVALVLIFILAFRRHKARRARQARELARRREARRASTAAAMAATERVRPVGRPMRPPTRPVPRPAEPNTMTGMTGPIWPTHDPN